MPKTPTATERPAKTATRNDLGVRVAPVNCEKQAAVVGSPERILEWIRGNPLPARSHRSAMEIDAGIKAERNAWD